MKPGGIKFGISKGEGAIAGFSTLGGGAMLLFGAIGIGNLLGEMLFYDWWEFDDINPIMGIGKYLLIFGGIWGIPLLLLQLYWAAMVFFSERNRAGLFMAICATQLWVSLIFHNQKEVGRFLEAWAIRGIACVLLIVLTIVLAVRRWRGSRSVGD